MDSSITIVPYQDEYAPGFARLNRDWLDAHDLYEEADGRQLYSPKESLLNSGGVIYIALLGTEVVGCCALVRQSSTKYELTKLAVDRSVRGRGLGRRMTEHAIQEARDKGASKISLLSSSRLSAAIQLYHSIGFVNKAIPGNQPYLTADVYMELDLSASNSMKPSV